MQLNKEIFTRLKESVVFFSNFNDGELLALLKSTQREVFEDNEIVFKEGTRGDKMYIVIAGQVKISRSIGRNQEEVLATLDAGALFGEMGPIDESPRSARATAGATRFCSACGRRSCGRTTWPWPTSSTRTSR